MVFENQIEGRCYSRSLLQGKYKSLLSHSSARNNPSAVTTLLIMPLCLLLVRPKGVTSTFCKPRFVFISWRKMPIRWRSFANTIRFYINLIFSLLLIRRNLTFPYFKFIFALLKQFPIGQLKHRMHKIRADFTQRFQHETAQMQTRMRCNDFHRM